MAGDWGGGEPEKTIWRERCRPCDKKIEASMVGVYPHAMVAEALPLFSVLCALLSSFWHRSPSVRWNVQRRAVSC